MCSVDYYLYCSYESGTRCLIILNSKEARVEGSSCVMALPQKDLAHHTVQESGCHHSSMGVVTPQTQCLQFALCQVREVDLLRVTSRNGRCCWSLDEVL